MRKLNVNGIKVYADFNNSMLSHFMINIKAGMLSDKKNKEGLSHFLEHMLFKGSEKFTKFELRDNVEQYGGYINAATSLESIQVISESLNDKTEINFEVIKEMLLKIKFTEKEFNIEKQIIFEEIKSYQDEPDYILWNNITQNILGISAEPGGNLKSVANINLDDVKQLYKQIINKNNISVFYSGGLSKTEIEKLITKYFCDLPVGRKKQVKNLEYKTNNVTVYDEHISNTFYNRIYGYKGIDNIEPQNKVNLEVLEYLLSSGMTSILFNELREKHGLCYSCSFSSIFFKKNSLLIINTEINKKNLIKTKKVINNIIKKLNKKITNKQLDKIKSKIKVKHLRNDAVGLAKIYWLNYLYKIRVNSTEQYFELLNKITKSSLIEFSDFVFNKLPESEIIIHGKRKNQ